MGEKRKIEGEQVKKSLHISQVAHQAYNGRQSVETLCHIGVLKANFSPHLYNTTPSPLPNVGFQVSRICLFPLQH